MGDILHPKKQAIVERLRRRIEDYRQHHGACLPRYELATNGLYEQHKQGTLLLQQRYLEPKTKKANKKNEHKKDGGHLQQNPQHKLLKRPAESPLNSTPASIDNYDDDTLHQIPAKLTRTCNNNGNGNPNLTQFSVEIVQQFTSSGSSQPQQIQTNVTVKALSGNGNVKPDVGGTGGSSGGTGTSKMTSERSPGVPNTASGIGTVECKQEPELELDGCLLGSSELGNGVGLPDSLANFGFMEDSSDEIIHPDTLKDLIAELTPDIMADFNFDKFDDTTDSVKGSDEMEKELLASTTGSGMMNLNPTSTTVCNLTPGSGSILTPASGSGILTMTPASASGCSGILTLSQSGGGQYSTAPTQGTQSSSSSTQLFDSTLPSMQGGRLPNYSTLGLDFNMKEPSPAAQTLKQMAEQHQNMQNKQNMQGIHGLGMSSPHSRSPFTNDFVMSTPQYANGGGTTNADFLPSNGAFMAKQGATMFPFSQNNPLMKQEPNMFGTIPSGNPPMGISDLESRKRVHQQGHMMHVQRLASAIDQKPGLGPQNQPGTRQMGVPTPPGVPNPTSQPLSFGTTKPLSHFTEPASSGSTASVQSSSPVPTQSGSMAMQMMQSQYIQAGNLGQQQYVSPQQSQQSRPQSGPNIQLNQSQQMQITQNNQHLQVSQGQHLQLQDMSSGTSASQQQNLFAYQPSPSDQFQLSLSQSQSVNFGPATRGPPNTSMDLGSGPGSVPPQFGDKVDPVTRQKVMQQQLLRQQMIEKQKLMMQQQQQQQQQMAFMNRPPPEYKPQTSSGSPSGPGGHMASMNQSGYAQNVHGMGSANGRSQVRMMHPQANLPNPGGHGGHGVPVMLGVQGGPQGPAAGQGTAPGTQSMPRFGGPQSGIGMVPGNQGGRIVSGNLGSTGPSVKGGPYSSALLRGQRPPNVNVGPEGLNISQRRPSSHDWRHLLIQNTGQKYQRPSFPQGNNNLMAASSYNTMQGVNQTGSMAMPGMNQQPVRMAAMPALRTASAQSMNLQGTMRRGSTNVAMNSPVTNQGQVGFSGPADFNLDFLDGLPDAGSGFTASDATDLLSSFDSVMPGGNASYMLDGSL